MRKGDSMLGVYILVSFGVLALIAAVAIYAHSEDNSFGTVVATLQDTQVDVKKVAQSCELLGQSLQSLVNANETLSERVTDVQMKSIPKVQGQFSQDLHRLAEDLKVLTIRQQTLEKKIIARDRNVNVNLSPTSAPMPVEIYERKRLKREPLLPKAGITPEPAK